MLLRSFAVLSLVHCWDLGLGMGSVSHSHLSDKDITCRRCMGGMVVLCVPHVDKVPGLLCVAGSFRCPDVPGFQL